MQSEGKQWNQVYTAIIELIRNVTKEEIKESDMTCTNDEIVRKQSQMLLYLNENSE